MADVQRTDGPQERGNQGGSQLARSQTSGDAARRSQDPFLLSTMDLFNTSPFSLMRRMSEEMDRMFGGFGSGRGQSGAGGGMWSPAIEVSERDGNYVVCAELPGIKPDEVKVELTDDAVVIQGDRRWESEQNQGGLQRSERRYGQFYRSIPIPEGVDAEQVRAKLENGVLEVTVPAPQKQSNRRQIPVQAAPGGATQGSGQSGSGQGSPGQSGPGDRKTH